jgi:O-antigen ligase
MYVFSIHFETWDPLNTGIDYLNTKITITLYLLSTIINPKTFYSITKIKYFVLPLIFLFILQTVMSYRNINTSYSDFFDVPTFLNFLILIVITNHALARKNIMRGIINSYVIGGIVLTIFYFLNIGTDHSWEGRSTIFGFNQNQLAVNLAILLILILWPVLGERMRIVNKSMLLSLVFVPFILIFLTATGSRSGIITFVLAITGLLFIKSSLSISRKIVTFSLAVVIMAIVLLFFSSNEVVSQRFSATINEGDMSGRDLRWFRVFEIILRHPFIGAGKTGYSFEMEQLFGYYSSPHNVLLETTAYTGALGLILLSVFFYRITKASIQIRKFSGNHIYLVLLSPIIIMTLFGHTLGAKAAYLIFAYIISKYLVVSRQMEKSLV